MKIYSILAMAVALVFVQLIGEGAVAACPPVRGLSASSIRPFDFSDHDLARIKMSKAGYVLVQKLHAGNKDLYVVSVFDPEMGHTYPRHVPIIEDGNDLGYISTKAGSEVCYAKVAQRSMRTGNAQSEKTIHPTEFLQHVLVITDNGSMEMSFDRQNNEYRMTKRH